MRIAAAICLLALSLTVPVAHAADHPNVLVLLTDDQQADAIRALGNSDVHTPNMDRLVDRGFAFRRAYCMGSTEPAVCLPSRAMILSGRSLYRVPLDLKDVTTLPQAFRQAGYTTFGTGKWHNGQPSFAKSFDIGQSVFFGGMSNQQAVPVVDLLDDGKFSPKRIGDQFSSEIFADAAAEFLKQHDKAKAFFAWVAFTSPHDPRTPPADVLAKYDPAKLKLPENCLPEHPFDNGELKIRDELLAPHPRTPAVMREHLAAYYGMITHLDAQIGRILAALDAAGATTTRSSSLPPITASHSAGTVSWASRICTSTRCGPRWCFPVRASLTAAARPWRICSTSAPPSAISQESRRQRESRGAACCL
jgi:arylsulfatase A-like enzyme